jgi:hypothetical protein
MIREMAGGPIMRDPSSDGVDRVTARIRSDGDGRYLDVEGTGAVVRVVPAETIPNDRSGAS